VGSTVAHIRRAMTTPSAPSPPAQPSLRTKLLWVAAFYFASGFPFGVATELLPVYYRQRGVSLTDIGLLSVIALPWTFKFLWAPLVDRIATYKRWLLSAQIGLAAAMLALLVADPTRAMPFLWVVLVAMATLSATQDIVVDAYTIRLLDTREYGAANGVRVTAYRVAMLVAGGLLLAAAGRLGWPTIFVMAAGTMLALCAISFTIPSREVARAGAGGLHDLIDPLRELLTLPAFAAVLLFVLTFKLGDLSLIPMTKPFWVDRGFSTESIGGASTVGIVAAIAGALVGGALTTRWGIFTALWSLGLVQALSNLGYWAASQMPAAVSVLYGTILLEQFTYGLGTAAFLSFLMSLCSKRFAATQYALLSALFRVGGVMAGAISGAVTEHVGYQTYFLTTFLLALPAFALLPWVRRAVMRPAGS
jgi:MFS transporter, PAT family, beta-lactamase induction signal transducer AmpG